MPTDTEVFVLDGDAVTVGDVLLVAHVSGEWGSFAERVELAEAALAGGWCEPTVDELRAAVEVFRRERNLLTAAELAAWMSARALDGDALAGSMRRRVATEAVRDRGHPPPLADRSGLAEALAVDLWCSPFMGVAVNRFLRWWAAGRRWPTDGSFHPPADRVDRVVDEVRADPICGATQWDVAVLRTRIAELLRLEQSYRSAVSWCLDSGRVDQVISRHVLQWSTVVREELTCLDEDVAREARLCLLVDERPIEEVALLASMTLVRHEQRWDELATTVEAALLAAGDGVLRPVRTDSGWSLHRIVERRQPTASAPVPRAEAVEIVIQDALDAPTLPLVTWKVSVT